MLQIIPDEEKLVDMFLKETTLMGEQVPTMTEDVFEELAKDTIAKQWVRKDDFSIAKAEVIMEGEITPDMVTGYGEGELTVKMTMTILTYGYNKQVYIELPTDAEEAISWEGTGEAEAKDTELANVQAAVYALMVDNEIATLPVPVTTATSNMDAFPDATVTLATKGADAAFVTAAIAAGDITAERLGWLLYGNQIVVDVDGDGTYDAVDGDAILEVNYVATRYSLYWYTCDANGTVKQYDTAS